MRENYSQTHAIVQWSEQNMIAGLFGDVRGGEDVAAANAALIVRAVNAFDPLVSALEDCRRELWDEWHAHMTQAKFEADPLIKQIDAALSLAKDGTK
jgi:hypothetical protein